MTKKPEQKPMTAKQQRTVHELNLQAFSVRGIQAFIMGLASYLAMFDGRGWPAFIIGVMLVLWLETRLPALPLWLDKMRPDDE